MTAPAESYTDACCKEHDLVCVNGNCAPEADQALQDCLVDVYDNTSGTEALYNYAAQAAMGAKVRSAELDGHVIKPQRERKKRNLEDSRRRGQLMKARIESDLLLKPKGVEKKVVEEIILESEKSKKQQKKKAAQNGFLKGAAAMAAAGGKPRRVRNPRKKQKRQARKLDRKLTRNAIRRQAAQLGARNLNPVTRVDSIIIRGGGKRKIRGDARHFLKVSGQDLWFAWSVPATPPAVGAPIAQQLLSPSTMNNMRMQVMSALFQKFRFKRFVVRYDPMSSTQNSGGMLMYVDTDPTTTYPSTGGNVNLQSAIARSGERSFAIYNPSRCRMIDPKDTAEYWVNYSEAIDPRTSAQGVVVLLAAETMPANAGGGLFLFDWDIEFMDWSLNGDNGPSPSLFSLWQQYTSTASVTCNTTTDLFSAVGPVSNLYTGYDPSNLLRFVNVSGIGWCLAFGNVSTPVQAETVYFVDIYASGSAAYKTSGAPTFTVTGSSAYGGAGTYNSGNPSNYTSTNLVSHGFVTITAPGIVYLTMSDADQTATYNTAYVRIFVSQQSALFKKMSIVSQESKIDLLTKRLDELAAQFGKKPVKEFIRALDEQGHLPPVEERGGIKLLQGASKRKPEEEESEQDVVQTLVDMSQDHSNNTQYIPISEWEERHVPTERIREIRVHEKGVVAVTFKKKEEEDEKEDTSSDREKRKQNRKSLN